MKYAYTVASPEAKADRVLAWRAPLEESLPALAELGYDGVELMVRGPEDMDGAAIAALAERHGMAISVVGTGPITHERGISLLTADDARRGEAVGAAMACVRLCRDLNAIMNIGQFRGRCEPNDVSAAKRRLADSLRQIIPLAEELNVRIALEAQNRFQSSFFRTADETLEFVESLGSRQVGVLLDTFHMNIEEGSFDGPLKRAGESLFYVHFSENHRGAPGTGMIPFDFVTRVLGEMGYDGWVSVEIAQVPSPQEAARKAMAGLSGVAKRR